MGLKTVKNQSSYPYCCIGLVTGKLEERRYYGTGCLIGSKIVLTCAHNIYDRSGKKKGSDLKFTLLMNDN